MPVDLLLYVVIAAVLVFWLRNTLGTRHGSERERPNPLEGMGQPRLETRGKILDITDGVYPDRDMVDDLLHGIDCQDKDAQQGILDLIRTDRSFDPHIFVEGARDAFPIIIESFAKGDLRTLKDLLSPGVYTAFEQAIEDRQVKGQTVATEIHAVRKTQIIDVRLMERMAYIKIRFIADETSVTRDRDGNILSGNPDRITEMNDVWTFGRDLRSKDPTWFLYETSDDVPEHAKTYIPDAK